MAIRVPINPETRASTGQLGYARAVDVTAGHRALGQVVSEYGRQLQEEDKKRELFDVQRRLVDETNNLLTDFEQRKESAPLGAPEFTKTINDEYSARHEAMVGELRAAGYSEDAIQEFSTRLGTIRSQYVARAIDFQDKSHFAKVGDDIDQLAIGLSQYANNNPNAVQSALDELEVALQHSGLDPIEQKQAFQQKRELILQGARQGFALQNPDVVIGLFDPDDALAPPGTPSSMELTNLGEPQKAVANEFSAVGFKLAVVAGFLGNFEVEGGYEGAQGDSGSAGGIAQWRGSRRANFIAQFGKDPTEATHAEQAKFVVWEMQNPDEAGMTVEQRDAILNASTPEEAAELIDKYYERSSGEAREQRKEAAKLFVRTMEKADTTIASLTEDYAVVEPGNIDVSQIRPVQNADGTVSTVQSITIEQDGTFYVIPSVIDGKVVSNDEAVSAFDRTRKHLGGFATQQDADAFAEALHKSEEQRVSTGVSPIGKTGIPILDMATGPERMQMLAWAKQYSGEKKSTERAGLEVTHQNAVNAYLTTGGYAGDPPDVERYTRIYGPVIGPQKFAELQNAEEVGQAIQQFKTLPNSAIQAQVERLRPKDTASPTYSEELQAYTRAREAADSVIKARDENPSGYLFSTFPAVAKQLADADSGVERRAAYLAVNEAYKRIGIEPNKRFLLTTEQANDLQEQYAAMPPKQKIAQLSQWNAELGELHEPFMQQLTKDGYGAGADAVMWSLLDNHPNGLSIMSQVLAGQQIIKEDPARKPSPETINSNFRNTLGSAISIMNPTASKIYNDAAAAIYVANGGQTESGELTDPDLYVDALRQAVGGRPKDENTGIVDMTQGAVKDWTILPGTISENQFTNWIERLTPGVLTRMSVEKTQPLYRTGNPVPLRDIIDEGVFVAVAPNKYIIKMASDGNPLKTSSGNNFVVQLNLRDAGRPWPEEQQRPVRRTTIPAAAISAGRIGR